MQEIGYTGDGKAEKANKRQWGSLELRDSKKPLQYGGWRVREEGNPQSPAAKDTWQKKEPHRGDLVSGRATAQRGNGRIFQLLPLSHTLNSHKCLPFAESVDLGAWEMKKVGVSPSVIQNRSGGVARGQ